MTKQETYKQQSDGLRGSIAQDLADDNAFVSDESYELLKFFGSYQGYNRDTATERKKQKLDKEWEFMLRLKMPAGRLTAQQYLALDKFCDARANGSLRITTRQTFQFHQIIKKNLKPFIAEISRELLSTLGGCGDVVRNITTCPAPVVDGKRDVMTGLAYDLAKIMAPKTEAYWDIFLDGEKLDYPFNPVVSGQSSVVSENTDNRQLTTDNPEPLYGSSYMPRKFKIGIAEPTDNCIDVLTNDLAMLALFEDGALQGYNIALGGGMGMKHNSDKTYPRMATPLAFVKPEDAIAIAEATVKLQRDYGDRTDRQHARLKYVVQEQGIGWTRDALEKYFGKALEINKPIHHFAIEEHMGWHAQGDGKYFLGIPIPSGRIIDIEGTARSGDRASTPNNFGNYAKEPAKRSPMEKSGDFSGAIKKSPYAGAQYRTGLREIISQYRMNLVLTADQNIILCDVEPGERAAIEKILRDHGIRLFEDITPLARHFHACVALPTCGKSLAEAERVEIPLVKELDALFAKHGLDKEEVSIRIAGCPNGCSRPYPAEIGIIGRMPGHYVLWIGGDFHGTRLGKQVFDKVPLEHITTALDPMLARYAAEREAGELFGDFCQRVGIEVLKNSAAAELTDYKWAA